MNTTTGTGRIASKKELADILGVTRHAVARMVALGCPYLEAGGREGGQAEWRFDTAAVVRWLHPDDPRHEAAVVSAALKKHQLEEKQARTMGKEDARELIGEEYDIVRAGLREIPGKVAENIAAASPERVDTVKIEKVLIREVESVLECLTADRTI